MDIATLSRYWNELNEDEQKRLAKVAESMLVMRAAGLDSSALPRSMHSPTFATARRPILDLEEFVRENKDQIEADEARMRRLHEQYSSATVDDIVHDLYVVTQMLLHKRHMETLRAVPDKG